MSHSHLHIGHISNTSVKLWARAGNEDEFEPPAAFDLKIIDPLSNQVVYTDACQLEDAKSFGCHVFDVQGINSDHEDFKVYEVIVKISLNETDSHELVGRFCTAPASTSKFSFFLGSCYFSQGKDHYSPEYDDLHEWANQLKPLFMINAGDQIYIDVMQGAIKHRKEKEYVNRHLDSWHSQGARTFFAHLPQYMILDDHELYNNFKVPNPSKTKRVDTFRNAKNVYYHFQHSHNPGPIRADKFYYDFKIADTAFFVLDVRTEKTKRQMISDDQLADFKEWVGCNAGRMKFIVTPVPLFIQLKAGQQKDKWSGDNYRCQRNQLLDIIVEAGCPKALFLTGDIHLSCHSKISFSANNRNWEFHEISSSPIKQLQFWIVDRKKTVIKNNRINNTQVDFEYKLLHYMGKRKNAHNAKAHQLQNNAMNITWDPDTQTVRYDALKLNSKPLETIYEGKIDFSQSL